MIWMFLSARWRSRCAILEPTHLTFRVLPTDLDVNMHLTNSRYFSFMDLSRVDHMIRNGSWKHIRANKLMPVLGGGSVRYRRAVPPFAKIHVSTRVAGVDDRWIYLEHKVSNGETVYAAAVLKAAFLDKKGRVPTPRLLDMFGHDGDVPELPDELAQIRDVDDAVNSVAGI